MEMVHQEVLETLREEFGESKVQQVDDLGGAVTSRMISGEKILGVEDWMYTVVDRFQELVISHPRMHITTH